MTASTTDGAAVAEGLDQVARDVPVGKGYALLDAGFDPTAGLYARAEAGIHPASNLTAFAFAQADTASGVSAGVGAKLTFDL